MRSHSHGVRLRTQIASAASYAERPCRPADARFWALPGGSTPAAVPIVVAIVSSPCSSPHARRVRTSRSGRATAPRATTVPSNEAGPTSEPSSSGGSTPEDSESVPAGCHRVGGVRRRCRRRDARRPDRLRRSRGPHRSSSYLARHRAAEPDERIGSLLVNPGGPGFGGSDDRHLRRARALRRRAARPVRHHRVGSSGHRPERAVRRLHRRLRPLLRRARHHTRHAQEQQEAVDLAEEFADDCVCRTMPTSSSTSARTTRRATSTSSASALGEETISYFGFSYGSELGATWATMFPDTVRAAVFDGARDPNADTTEWSLQQLGRFREHALDLPRPMQRRHRLRVPQRRRRGGCVRRADGRARRESDPGRARPPRRQPWRRPARDLRSDVQAQRSVLAGIRGVARRGKDGDGSGLRAFADTYFQRRADGTFGNELEAFQAINCADTTERLDRRRGGRVVGASTPRSRPVSPRPARPAATRARSSHPRSIRASRSPAPEQARSSSSAPRVTRRRRSTSTQAMAEALEDGRARRGRGRPTHRIQRELVHQRRRQRLPRRSRPARQRHRMSLRRRTRDRTDSTGGRSGIRTHGDPKDLNGFRGRPIRPLWHPSVERG